MPRRVLGRDSPQVFGSPVLSSFPRDSALTSTISPRTPNRRELKRTPDPSSRGTPNRRVFQGFGCPRPGPGRCSRETNRRISGPRHAFSVGPVCVRSGGITSSREAVHEHRHRASDCDDQDELDQAAAREPGQAWGPARGASGIGGRQANLEDVAEEGESRRQVDQGDQADSQRREPFAPDLREGGEPGHRPGRGQGEALEPTDGEPRKSHAA